MQASLKQRIKQHLETIYRYEGHELAFKDSLIISEQMLGKTVAQLINIMGLEDRLLNGKNLSAKVIKKENTDVQNVGRKLRIKNSRTSKRITDNSWDENDIVMISYADSIIEEQHTKNVQQQDAQIKKAPFELLTDFIDQRLANIVNTVHLLPFYPYTSDDGFAVSDYDTVREDLGSWHHIKALSERYKIMADLVINHCSSNHPWVQDLKADREPGKNFIYLASPDDDLSQVVRPRTNPLLQAIQTETGIKHAWCTFSDDQIDLNFENPALLVEVVKIIKRYLDQGVRIFRLDAIAFIWKKVGTSSVNLPQTHEIVRLIRTLIEAYDREAVIITETNIPNRENLSYFGNLNEAHWIYNFSLPPLLLNTLISGNSKHLKHWMMSMPPAQNGTAYFNFIASHDGIGLRPTEGLLSDREIDSLIATMQNFGGKVSYRALEDGASKPYEINIALYDALQGTHDGPDNLGLERFICAHTIMLALEGIPAFYIHSLLGTRNDYQRMEAQGTNRAINRHQWQQAKLNAELDNNQSTHSKVYERLSNLIELRKLQKAFHPNATQFTLHLDDTLFGFWRQSIDRSQSIFCISNISRETQEVSLSSINLISTNEWFDLISRESCSESEQSISLKPYQTVWISNKLLGIQ